MRSGGGGTVYSMDQGPSRTQRLSLAQQLILIASAAFLIATLAAVALFGRWAWGWPMTVDQRLMVIGDSISGGALILAALAVVLALSAYLVSSPKALLDVIVSQLGRHALGLRLANKGRDSAYSPMVHARLDGLEGVGGLQTGWTIESDGFLWDGSADVVVYPGWFRDLPPIDLSGAHRIAGKSPQLTVTVVTEHSTRRYVMPLQVD